GRKKAKRYATPANHESLPHFDPRPAARVAASILRKVGAPHAIIGRVAMWCVDNYNEPQMLNVSTMEETSIKDAAYMIAEFLGIDAKRLTFDTSKPAGTPRQAIDNTKFMSLSHFTYMPARETIKRTVEYFAANYPDPKKLRL
ncbi:MAG: hypothetical protein AAB867_03100, partial [Patescibacteria group bacterium]